MPAKKLFCGVGVSQDFCFYQHVNNVEGRGNCRCENAGESASKCGLQNGCELGGEGCGGSEKNGELGAEIYEEREINPEEWPVVCVGG